MESIYYIYSLSVGTRIRSECHAFTVDLNPARNTLGTGELGHSGKFLFPFLANALQTRKRAFTFEGTLFPPLHPCMHRAHWRHSCSVEFQTA